MCNHLLRHLCHRLAHLLLHRFPLRLLPSLPPGTPLPRLDTERMGIQVDYNRTVPEFAQVLGRAQPLRVGWVKFQANWAFIQPNGPDQCDQTCAIFEWYVKDAERQGFKVLVSIAKAPNWARSNQGEAGPPDNPQDLVNFINLLLNKVGPNIDAIEVWNEPNLQREWTGTLPFSGEGYMQLFRPAYDAIRAYSANDANYNRWTRTNSGWWYG